MGKMPGKKPKGTKLQSVGLGGEIIKVNDCVLINPDPSTSSGMAYIGKVIAIIKPDAGDDTQLHVNWFYRPEEAVGGRKAFHGEKELFLSDHLDYISVKTVIHKCRVLSLAKYQELSKIEEYDFFARFTYKPALRVFEPPKVPVFCVCEMPYNPDQFMVQCDACTEWYHPECLNTTRKALKSQTNWQCPECVRQKGLAVSTPAAEEGGDLKRRKTDGSND